MIRINRGDGPVWEDAEYDEEDVIDGIPHLTAVEYRSEGVYKAHLIELLKAYDWDVETEVSDDGNNGYVDIVAEHPAVGAIGIEVKRTYGHRGRFLAEGIAQVMNYRSYTYSDHDIEYWALAPGFDATPSGYSGSQFKKTRNMFRQTLAELKLGMLSRRREAIGFGKARYLGIPLREPESVNEEDLDRINDSLAGRKLEVSRRGPPESEMHD